MNTIAKYTVYQKHATMKRTHEICQKNFNVQRDNLFFKIKFNVL